MSLVEQLVEDVKELVVLNKKWIRTSEKYPDPAKLDYICALHDGKIYFLTSVTIALWKCGSIYYSITDHDQYPHYFKNVFDWWCEPTIPPMPI